MNLTVNGQSQVPPGFRFHPTEEELLMYYLKKKVTNQKIDLDVIQDVDLNKLEPWDIQEKCKIGSSAQNDWYFFSHKDKKYPTGTRTNRATIAGFWKATGRDKVICSSSRRIGMRKTLVFYMGRAPHGEKSDWIMHEYRLDDNSPAHNASSCDEDQSEMKEVDGWVICRVFKKKNYIKAESIDQTTRTLSSTTQDLDQILSNTRKTTTNTNIKHTCRSPSLTEMDQMVQERFLHLPQLESPTNTIDPLPFNGNNSNTDQLQSMFDCGSYNKHEQQQNSTANWVELDQLVAYQLDTSCQSTNHFGSDEHTMSPSTPFQQLLRSQSSSSVYDDEISGDQIYWSFSPRHHRWT